MNKKDKPPQVWEHTEGKNGMLRASIKYPNIRNWWEQRDLNPPQRISSETTSLDEATVCRIATGRRSSWSSTVSKPTRRHSCATGARDTTKLYYTPIVCHTKSSLGLSASALTAS